MKKIILLAMAFGIFGFTSCSNDEEEDIPAYTAEQCVEIAEVYEEANVAYFMDQSDENCATLDSIAGIYSHSSCYGNANSFNCAEIAALLDELGGDCDELTTSTEETAIAYANDPSEENCAAYKAALEAYLDAECDNNQNQQMIYDSLPCE